LVSGTTRRYKSQDPFPGEFITVTLLHEPEGWQKLQAMAQQETDPQRLESIIDRMNRLLDRHEKMAADQNTPSGTSRSRVSDSPARLDVQIWRFEV